ncbi:MAG: hypothetical protein KDB70_07940 [Mycobacterium sp.]|nr:hypothetical protein [Mycobacterium sp.]
MTFDNGESKTWHTTGYSITQDGASDIGGTAWDGSTISLDLRYDKDGRSWLFAVRRPSEYRAPDDRSYRVQTTEFKWDTTNLNGTVTNNLQGDCNCRACNMKFEQIATFTVTRVS